MTHVSAHNDLLRHGFKVRIDNMDQRIIRNVYTRYAGWFRIRVMLPTTDKGKPALWFGLRLASDVAASEYTGEHWADWRSALARPTVSSVVDNALGFLSVVEVY